MRCLHCAPELGRQKLVERASPSAADFTRSRPRLQNSSVRTSRYVSPKAQARALSVTSSNPLDQERFYFSQPDPLLFHRVSFANCYCTLIHRPVFPDRIEIYRHAIGSTRLILASITPSDRTRLIVKTIICGRSRSTISRAWRTSRSLFFSKGKTPHLIGAIRGWNLSRVRVSALPFSSVTCSSSNAAQIKARTSFDPHRRWAQQHVE